MRNFCVAFFALCISVSSFAIPERSDILIKELITNNKEFSALLDEVIGSSDGFMGAFGAMEIERALSDEMRRTCGRNSRSAAGLRITFKTEPAQSYYFVTPDAVENLKRCE